VFARRRPPERKRIDVNDVVRSALELQTPEFDLRGVRVVTDLAVFGFGGEGRRMQVISLNPGVSRKQLQDNTGFRLDFAADTGVTEPPTDQELKMLRELDPEQLYTA